MLDRIGAAYRAATDFFAKASHDFVNTVLDRTWFAVALFILVVGPFTVNTIYDRVHNYSAATVQISRVERICYVDKVPGERSREPLPIAWCDALRQEAEKQGLLEDLRIHEATFVHFNYTSPVDGEVHEGQLQRSASSKPPEVNEEIRILVSRIDPALVRD